MLQVSLRSRTVGGTTQFSSTTRACPSLAFSETTLRVPSIWVTRDCHKYFPFPCWKQEALAGWIRSGACALSFGGWEDISTFYGPGKNLPKSYSSKAFVSWNATVPSVPPPPPAQRAHQP